MKWLYKIWSGYDGFRPNAIKGRLASGGELDLGWERYLDQAEPGDEVWVWFFGPGSFEPGVYVKGIIESIDRSTQKVRLQTQEWSASKSLTTTLENEQLAPVVRPRFRQVFILPEDFRRLDACTAGLPGAPSCQSRQCDHCSYWQALPLIKQGQVRTPSLIASEIDAFAPAYWVIGRRSFVWNQMGVARPGVKKTSEMFYRFKTGEEALVYPLAKGMVQALAARNHLEASAIVPIPLSPDKKKAGEINRTELLARTLSRLIQVPVVPALELRAPIGKRAALGAGDSPDKFRRDYVGLLDVNESALAGADKVILLDDVCTYGNTLRATIDAMRKAGVDAAFVAATAGQMTIQDAVLVRSAVLKPTSP